MSAGTTRALRDLYRRLLGGYGPQHWWPADEPFEIMVGAILTQSTAWGNVEKAIANLKAAGVMSPPAFRRLSPLELATLVRPSGYFTAKAKKLRALVDWLGQHDDDITGLAGEDSAPLRKELLSVYGVGEETADSILLYALGKAVFVIDTYTRRTMDRIGRPFSVFRSQQTARRKAGTSYADYQRLFMDHLPADAALFNEYHALFVRHGKKMCRQKPLCPQCYLLDACDFGRGAGSFRAGID